MEKDIKKIVRENYARIALQETGCCGSSCSCCGSGSAARKTSLGIGYSDADMGSVPEGANLGLGCGNPVALASLEEGETVLDLGSGAGFDCFLAAGRVGEKGRVIGVDMTPEMLYRARENAQKGGYRNVEFRLGEIENLPAADSSVDAVISNCVINLSPDKERVFREVYRVLKPGGRLMISDIVLLKEMPRGILDSIEMYVSCVAGASMRDDYLRIIKAAGFAAVEVMGETIFPVTPGNEPAPAKTKEYPGISTEEMIDISSSVASIKVRAWKR